MKRKGETFTEFLTASVVFGIIMAGLFEFTANHTQILADTKDRDNLMFHAQNFLAVSHDLVYGNEIKDYDDHYHKENITFKLTDNRTILTVTNNTASMRFRLKP